MYVKGKNRGGQTPLPAHPKKHHKPYRIRHIGLFIAGVALVILSAFEAGYLLGQAGTAIPVEPAESTPAPAKSTLGTVISGRGYSFRYDTSVFSASGKTDSDSSRTITGDKLKQKLDLGEIRLQPKSSSVTGSEALSALKINVERDKALFDSYKLNGGYTDENKALVSYFAPKNDQDFNIRQISQTSQSIGSVKFLKTTYVQKPRFSSSAKPVFSVMWTGTSHGRPVRIYLQNLLGGGQIPSIYGTVFDTLHFSSAARNGVLSDMTGAGQDFDLNKISPAVVKIYHFVCGTLVINDLKYGRDACDGGSGSGFLVSGDGYIATSGHVVVLDAADILVNALLSNPDLLRQFTAEAGLSAEQSARTDVVASLLAKIYDLPPKKLRLENRREATFVALGSQPLPASNQEEAKKALDTPDSDYIKKAEIVAVDYQPKDLLVIEQQDQDGFSASDVALLKVNAVNSPYIRLADSSRLEQNDPISLIGFPADADNQLTENSAISTSITAGTISSIRQANGSASLLFQTDADASEGNSGGPAINRTGQAFGLVTYRFKSGNATNAAKSYVRDIADFSDLVDSKNISLDVRSAAQTDWETGLDLFKTERYSKALIKFGQVQRLYPAHRLVSGYISQAAQAVREGRDKKDPPYAVIGIITATLSGVITSWAAAWLIIRHRRLHLAYKIAHSSRPEVIAPH